MCLLCVLGRSGGLRRTCAAAVSPGKGKGISAASIPAAPRPVAAVHSTAMNSNAENGTLWQAAQRPINPAFGAPGRFADRMRKGPVICAEGYLFELERRGFVQFGPFVPEVVLNEPEAVKQLHREFLRAGSDVIEAFTYYGHRAKMRLVGKEHLLEPLNRQALVIAQQVAMEAVEIHGDAEPALVAGNVSNSTIWSDTDVDKQREVRAMFDEQIGWAVEHGVDLVIGETFDFFGEAMCALEAIKAAGANASVITLAVHADPTSRDGMSPLECLQELERAGADVVGLNCARGPETMLDVIPELRAGIGIPLAALPVCYRTTEQHPTFQSLSSDDFDKKYCDLDPHTCTREDLRDFTTKAVEMGVGYLGVCCGGAPHHVRAMSEALGRSPPGSTFSPDLSKHFAYGNKEGLGELADASNLSQARGKMGKLQE